MGKHEYAMDGYKEEDAPEETPYEKSPVLSIVMIFVMGGYGLLCIVFDWLWVSDMLNVETALVFGPADTAIIVTMIVISSIGTIAFFAEVGNMIYKTFYGEERLDEQVSQLITLFVEEVPSITLNWMLAACREVPMSYFQMFKAVLALVGAAIRVVRTMLSWCQKGQKRGLMATVMRIIVLSACVYVCLGSCMVFIFTYSDPHGETQQPPEGLGKSYDSDRYLYKAGVYYSHPDFQNCSRTGSNGPGHIATDGDYAIQNWIKLGGIYEIQDSKNATSYYYKQDNYSYINISITNDESVLHYCYKTNLLNCTITDNTTCPPPHESTEVIMMWFGHKEADKTLVFGDVTYQAALKTNGQCYRLEGTEWGLLEDCRDQYGQLQYYQIRNDSLNDTHPFHQINDKWVYYRNGEEFQNVTDVWRTGFFECEMSGSMYPNLDESLGLCGASRLYPGIIHLIRWSILYSLVRRFIDMSQDLNQ